MLAEDVVLIQLECEYYMVQVAAIVYASLMASVVLFQLCLAVGLPWGEASMGGKYPGKYPPKMRAVAVVNMLVLSLILLIVLIHSGLILPSLHSISKVAIWFVVAFSAVSVLLNTITKSKIEKRIWAPVTILQFVACLIVAIG